MLKHVGGKRPGAPGVGGAAPDKGAAPERDGAASNTNGAAPERDGVASNTNGAASKGSAPEPAVEARAGAGTLASKGSTPSAEVTARARGETSGGRVELPMRPLGKDELPGRGAPPPLGRAATLASSAGSSFDSLHLRTSGSGGSIEWSIPRVKRGRDSVARLIERASRGSISPEDARAIHDYVDANWDAITKRQEAFLLKPGAGAPAGAPQRSIEVHPGPVERDERSFGEPAVVVRTKVVIGAGAQKKVSAAVVLRRSGSKIEGVEAVRATALGHEEPGIAGENIADVDRESSNLAALERGGPSGSGPAANVVGFLASYEVPRGTPRAGRLTKRVLVMERLDTTLRAMLAGARPPLDVGVRRELMHQAVLGLMAIHARGLVSGDVKTENMLVSQRGSEIKLVHSDFALAKRTDEAGSGKLAGTWPYYAPRQAAELLEERPVMQTMADDIFALAIVLHEIAYGEMPAFVQASSGPFNHAGNLDRALKESSSLGTNPLSEEVPDGPFKQVICGLLHPDEQRRLSLEAALRLLEAEQERPRTLAQALGDRERRFSARIFLLQLAQNVARLHAKDDVHGAISADTIVVREPEDRRLPPSLQLGKCALSARSKAEDIRDCAAVMRMIIEAARGRAEARGLAEGRGAQALLSAQLDELMTRMGGDPGPTADEVLKALRDLFPVPRETRPTAAASALPPPSAAQDAAARPAEPTDAPISPFAAFAGSS